MKNNISACISCYSFWIYHNYLQKFGSTWKYYAQAQCICCLWDFFSVCCWSWLLCRTVKAGEVKQLWNSCESLRVNCHIYL